MVAGVTGVYNRGSLVMSDHAVIVWKNPHCLTSFVRIIPLAK